MSGEKDDGTDKSDSQQEAGSSCTVADKSGDEGWQALIELWWLRKKYVPETGQIIYKWWYEPQQYVSISTGKLKYYKACTSTLQPGKDLLGFMLIEYLESYIF